VPPVSYHNSRIRLVLCASGLLAIAIFLVTHLRPYPVFTVLVVLSLCLLASFPVYRLVNRVPEIVVMDDGFKHWRLPLIAWQEVVSVAVRRDGHRFTTRASYVVVEFHDPAAYFAKRPRRVRALAGSNINMSTTLLSASASDIAAEMCQRRERFLAASEVSDEIRPARADRS
jgi:hypothetical protein